MFMATGKPSTERDEDITNLIQSKRNRYAKGIQNIASTLFIPFWFSAKLLHSLFLPLPKGISFWKKAVLYSYRLSLFSCGLGIALIAILFASIALALTGIANKLHTRAYLYLPGRAKEIVSKEIDVFTLNSSMLPGPLPYIFDRIVTAKLRLGMLIDHIIEEQKENRAQLLFLSEVSRIIERKLYEKLQKYYRHFFLSIGLSSFGQESGLFIGTNCKLSSSPCFIPFITRGVGIQSFYKRGFFILEVEEGGFVFSHLSPGKGKKEDRVRQKQLREIVREIEKREKKRWVVLGDFNIDRFAKEDRAYEQMMELGFFNPVPNAMQEPTVKGSAIDYLLIYKPNRENVLLKEIVFRDAPSNHRSLQGTFIFLEGK